MEIMFANDEMAYETASYLGLEDDEIKLFRSKKIPKKVAKNIMEKKKMETPEIAEGGESSLFSGTETSKKSSKEESSSEKAIEEKKVESKTSSKEETKAKKRASKDSNKDKKSSKSKIKSNKKDEEEKAKDENKGKQTSLFQF